MTVLATFEAEVAVSPARRRGVLRAAFGPLAALADALIILALSIASGLAYHLLAYGQLGPFGGYLQVGVLATSLFLLPNIARGEYTIANYLAARGHAERSFYLWNAAFLCLLLLAFLTKTTEAYSRGWLLLFYAAGLGGLAVARLALVRAVAVGAKIGWLAPRRLMLVGRAEDMAAFAGRYQPWNLGYQVVGVAPLSASGTHEALDLDVQIAAANARSLAPDDVFLIVPWSDHVTIERCTAAFRALPTSIHLGPERILDHFEDVRIQKVGPLASLGLSRPPLSTLEVCLKRGLDLALSATALLALLPLFAVIAALIKRDGPGPVFFLQTRYGFNQRPFRIFKFRTMTTLDDGDVIPQARAQDPRVTRVGRVLRAWNFDELPQLANVLMGDMSLVGPRPHALAHDREYERRIALYARRHNVRPGITGWAQVSGLRGLTDTDEKMRRRVEHDLYYIDNWSLWFDLRILFLTAFSRNAYRNAL